MTAVLPVPANPSGATDPTLGHAPPSGAHPSLTMRFRAEDGNDVALGHAHRPSWRGGIHVIGLLLAIPAAGALVVSSTDDPRVRLGVIVCVVGLCSMLGTSATYHRLVHGLRARCTWRHLDHAAIFAAIAGSSTPIVLVALPGAPGVGLAGVIWSAAALGAWCKLSRWGGGDRAGSGMYALTIVLGAVAVPWLWAREGSGPTVFSYHEVWHVFTIIAAVAQVVAIWMLVTR